MPGKLARTLGLSSLTLYGIGMILGAGIYSVMGAAAGEAGHGLWLAFVLGAGLALLTGLSYAELSTTYPRAGAEYEYVGRALPARRDVATVVGIIMVFAGAGTAATVALAFSGYLGVLIAVPRWLAALGLLAFITVVNLVGARISSRVNAVLTVIEAGGLVLVVVLGAGDADLGARAFSVAPAGVLVGAAMVFFAYLGFENVVALAEEARKPERDLPRAILIGIGVTTALYVLVALAAVALLPPERLAAADAPLAAAAATVHPRYAIVLGVVALFATANTGLIAVLTAARVLFAMARDDQLPARLSGVNRRKVPWLAIVLVVAAVVPLILIGDVAVAAGVSSFAALIAFAAVNLSVIVLRFTDAGRRRPFRVPGTLGRVPVLPLLGVLSCALFLTRFDGIVYLTGGVATALAIGLVLAHRVRAHYTASA
jgi:APA family basic amino acid/polyamine antiporter